MQSTPVRSSTQKKRGRQVDEEVKDDSEEPQVSSTFNARDSLAQYMKPVRGQSWAAMEDDEKDDGASTPVHATSARAPNRASSATLPMSSLGSLSSPSKITNTRTPSIRNQSPASGRGAKKQRGGQ